MPRVTTPSSGLCAELASRRRAGRTLSRASDRKVLLDACRQVATDAPELLQDVQIGPNVVGIGLCRIGPSPGVLDPTVFAQGVCDAARQQMVVAEIDDDPA